MDQTSSAVDEPKPQAETRAPQSPSPQTPPDSEAQYKRRSVFFSNPRARLGLILAGLVVLIGVFFLWRYLESYESTDDAQIDGHVNSVSARVSGHVLKLNVEDNQYVEKGTVLVEIDPADYEVAVAQARADYADAQAQAAAAGINVPITNVSTSSQVSGAQAGVSSAQAGIAAARQQLEAAKSQIVEAEANNTKAQNDLVRYKELIDKQEISQQQYDQAVASAHAAAATVQAARAHADALRGADRTGLRKNAAGQRRASHCRHGAADDARHARPRSFRASQRRSQKSSVGPGRTESPVHESDCAGQWSGQQSHRRGRPKRATRPGDDENHPPRRG